MSTARSAMRFDNSWMVIASGMMTSRENFSVGFWKPCACFFRRSVRRRKAATERLRSSSSDKAFDKVSLPRRFSASALVLAPEPAVP